MLQKRGVVLLALACSLVGCDSSRLTVPQEVADFDEMRELWAEQDIRDYYVEVSLSNEWVTPYTMGFEVRNGVVNRVRGAVGEPNGGSVGEWRSPTPFEQNLVMDSVYSHIAQEMADPQAIVETRFDTRIGLLTFVSVDRPAWADDSYGFIVKRFVRQ